MAEIVDSYNGRIFREPPYVWDALAGLQDEPYRWIPSERTEAETSERIEGLRSEAKSMIAAVSGFAAALEPYLDPEGGFWWLERAEEDPRYGAVIGRLRAMVGEFKDAERHQRRADERLLTLDDVKELTEEFVTAYPYWRTAVERVGGIGPRPAERVPSVGPGEGYGSPLREGHEERARHRTRYDVDAPMVVEPIVDPPWQEVVSSSLALFRRYEEGQAERDSLLDWDRRIARLSELYAHFASLLDDVPAFVWTKLFRDALLVPHSAPYVAVTQLLGEDVRSLAESAREARVAAIAEEAGVDADLLREALAPGRRTQAPRAS